MWECGALKLTKMNKSMRNVKLQIVAKWVEVKHVQRIDVLRLFILHNGENWM